MADRGAHAGHEEHVVRPGTYVLVFAGLIVLTALTTAVSYVDMGVMNTAVAIVIAVVKMLMVALFFMHVYYSRKLTKIVVGGGMLWLVILLLLTMTDIVTRGWLGVPGR
jgi:cytochrome c oxidase subunit IV